LATAKEQNFQLSLSEANERAQNAEKAAESEKLERVRLEAEIQPRRLSHEEQVEISRDLRHFAGMTVALATYSQDTEAMVFAIQIQEALKMADLTVVDLIGRFHASGTPIFLGVIVDMNSKNKELADAIFHAVQKQKKFQSSENTVLFGEGSTMYVPANTKPSDAFILIGAKPLKEAKP
jgi:hypothetical protein